MNSGLDMYVHLTCSFDLYGGLHMYMHPTCSDALGT